MPRFDWGPGHAIALLDEVIREQRKTIDTMKKASEALALLVPVVAAAREVGECTAAISLHDLCIQRLREALEKLPKPEPVEPAYDVLPVLKALEGYAGPISCGWCKERLGLCKCRGEGGHS